MTDIERYEAHVRLTDLADKIVDKAMASGEPFSEELCNRALDEAEQQLLAI